MIAPKGRRRSRVAARRRTISYSRNELTEKLANITEASCEETSSPWRRPRRHSQGGLSKLIPEDAADGEDSRPKVDEIYQRKCRETTQAIADHYTHQLKPLEREIIARRLGSLARPEDETPKGTFGGAHNAVIEQSRFLREERARECSLSHGVASRLREGLVRDQWLRTEVDVGVLEAWLRSFTLFQDLTKDARIRVARALRLVALNSGEVLYEAGERNSSGLFIVMQGAIELLNVAAAGPKTAKKEPGVFTTLLAGDAVGQRALLQPGAVREFTARAESRSVLLQLSVATFQQLKTTEKTACCEIQTALETSLASSRPFAQYNEEEIDEDALQACVRSSAKLLALRTPLLQLLTEDLAAKVCAKAKLCHFPRGQEAKVDGVMLILRGSLHALTEPSTERREASDDAKANLEKLKQYFQAENIWWSDLYRQKKFRLRRPRGIMALFREGSRSKVTSTAEGAASVHTDETATALAEDICGDDDDGDHIETAAGANDDDDGDDDDDDDDDDEADDLLPTVSMCGKLPTAPETTRPRGCDRYSSVKISKVANGPPMGFLFGRSDAPRKIRQTFVKEVESQRRRRSSTAQKVIDAEDFMDRFKKSAVAAITSRLAPEWRENTRGQISLCRLDSGTVLSDLPVLAGKGQGHSCGRIVIDTGVSSQLAGTNLEADRQTGCLALVIPQDVVFEALRSHKVERKKGRRKSNVAMSHFFALPHQHRTDADLITVADKLREMTSFSQLPPSTRKEMCRNAKIETFKAGEVVVSQGDVRADKYYIVLCGSVSVLKLPDKQPARRLGDFRTSFGQCVLVLRSGMAFGEAAMLHKTGRSASVIAREPCCLLSIGYGEYARIFQLNMCWKERKLKHHAELTPELREALERDPGLRSSEDIDALVEWSANLQFFHHLNSRARRLLCSEMRYARIETNEAVFREHDEANDAFIVLSGGISVHRRPQPSSAQGSGGEDIVRLHKELKVGARVDDRQMKYLGYCVDVVIVGQMTLQANPRDLGRQRPGVEQEWYRTASGLSRGLTEVCMIDTGVIRRLVEDNQSVMLPDLVKEIVSKPLSMRSSGESQTLENLLLRIGFLKQLSHEPAVIQRLAQVVRVTASPAADLLFRQGEKGDMLYILLRGSVQIRKTSAAPVAADNLQSAPSALRMLRREGSRPKLTKKQCISGLKTGAFRLSGSEDLRVLDYHFGDLAAELSTGDSFGEMALFPDSEVRNGTAITMEPCLFLTLLRNDFEETLRLHLKSLVFQPNVAKAKLATRGALNPVDHIRGIRAILDNLEIGKDLRALGDDRLNAICERLDYTVLTSGHVLAHKGDTARRMYIIVKGTIQETASSGEDGETDAVKHRTGDTVLEAAIAFGVTQNSTLKSAGRTVVLYLPAYWYRKLWPVEIRLGGRLSALKRSTAFASAYPRELAILSGIMQLRKLPRNVDVDCQGLLVLLREGACEVHSREESGIVLAELGAGETFGEGYCCGHDKFVRQLSRERLVTKCQSEAFMLPADQVAAILTPSTMDHFVKLASVKHAWHLAYLSRQAGVARRSDHTKAQLLLREAIIARARQQDDATRNILVSNGCESGRFGDPGPDDLARVRFPGNPFRGEDWTQVHCIARKKSAAPKAAAEVRAPVRPSAAAQNVTMLSCLGQKLAKSTRSSAQGSKASRQQSQRQDQMPRS